MQRYKSRNWSTKLMLAGSLLLLTAGAGDRGRAQASQAAEHSAAPVQMPVQSSSQQKPGTIVCPVTAETNPPLSPPLANALVLYRTGKFEEAIAVYNSVVPLGGSEAAAAYAGLARVYLKQDKVAEAYAAATKAAALTPDRAPAIVALGEVYFRQGRLGDSEELFLKPLWKCNLDARAYLGLTYLYWVSLNFKHAKNNIDQAYALDPADPDIRRAYLQTLTGAERLQFLKNYLASATNDDAETRKNMEHELTILENENNVQQHNCRLVTKVSKTETRMEPMMYDARHLRGYGLSVKVNGVSSRLLLDTGASGILVDSKIAAKAGIKPMVDEKIQGIGDKSAMTGFVGYADKIQIGELEFQGCIVEVASGRSVLGDDGLIGADVFRQFLVDLNMPDGKFNLSPLPPFPDEPAATTSLETETLSVRHLHDRYIPPEMKDYTKIFLFGHDMLITTHVNNSTGKLFLIDTGSFDDTLSPSAAKEVTKVNRDEDMKVKGLNGDVKEVYRASHAKLQFAHFSHDRYDLVTFDLTKISNSDGTEVSGVLGFAMLAMFDMKIDYRDGLVDFTFDKNRFH
jgi:tetratricopeptide (TPR) repeat protein